MYVRIGTTSIIISIITALYNKYEYNNINITGHYTLSDGKHNNNNINITGGHIK